MKFHTALASGLLALSLPMTLLAAEDSIVVINELPTGSVSTEAGLEAWGIVYSVTSHPRCANCHTGADNKPMWSGPSYGNPRSHGMNINAGNSRIGAESLMCATCHTTLPKKDANANDVAHAAPRVAMPWRLAPVDAEWFGKTSHYVCNQIKDPARNGNRSIKDVAQHLDHDLILHWAWNPGGNREPAPHSLQELVDALMQWSAAGAPCLHEDGTLQKAGAVTTEENDTRSTDTKAATTEEAKQ